MAREARTALALTARMKQLGKGLVSLTLSLVIFFAGGEVVLRTWLRGQVHYDLEMARYVATVETPSPDPRIAYVQKPGTHRRLMGVDVEINSHGLRDQEYPIEGGGARRIAFLGDSLTFGWGVEKHETFEHLVEKKLNEARPTEILNFGTPGYNTEQEVYHFVEHGLVFGPDEVLVFYFINDAEPTRPKSQWSFLGRSRFATFLRSKAGSALARHSGSKDFLAHYTALYREDQPGWMAAQDGLLLLRKVCAENDVALGVILLPELHELEDYPFRREHGMVLSFLERHGIPSLDTTSFFSSESDPRRLWVAPDDAHPNATAHRSIADLTLSFLEKADS